MRQFAVSIGALMNENRTFMAMARVPLPYSDSAFAPAISANTLRIDHGERHQADVERTNRAIEGTALDYRSLAAIMP